MGFAKDLDLCLPFIKSCKGIPIFETIFCIFELGEAKQSKKGNIDTH